MCPHRLLDGINSSYLETRCDNDGNFHRLSGTSSRGRTKWVSALSDLNDTGAKGGPTLPRNPPEQRTIDDCVRRCTINQLFEHLSPLLGFRFTHSRKKRRICSSSLPPAIPKTRFTQNSDRGGIKINKERDVFAQLLRRSFIKEIRQKLFLSPRHGQIVKADMILGLLNKNFPW